MNSVESVSACSLRGIAALRPKISKVANASAYTAVHAHPVRPRLPKAPLLAPTLNYTRAWCHGSGLVSACCRRCVTFSALRHIRRCIHTAVGKLNVSCLSFHSLSPRPFWPGKEILGFRLSIKPEPLSPSRKFLSLFWRVREIVPRPFGTGKKILGF